MGFTCPLFVGSSHTFSGKNDLYNTVNVESEINYR